MWQLARVLFGVSGALWLVIGALTPFAMDRDFGRTTLFGSPQTDAALYGDRPERLLDTNRELATFREVALRAIGGLLVAAGVLVLAIALFWLRDVAAWPLATLTVVSFAVLPYWWLAFRPYREAQIPLRVFDLPPFMWIPGVLMPLASLLGWLAFRARWSKPYRVWHEPFDVMAANEDEAQRLAAQRIAEAPRGYGGFNIAESNLSSLDYRASRRRRKKP